MSQTFEAAWRASSAVEGWLLEAQGHALYDAARNVAAGEAIVEIGSHRGKSAILIASALPEGVSFTAVDPFDDPRWGGGPESLEIFQRNLASAGVSERVRLFRGLSAEASASWSGPKVGFLWVDGAHDLESTLADFDGWRPHMAPGARMYVHDAFSAVGTTRAILRRYVLSRDVRYLGCERTMVMFRYENLNPLQRVVSTLGLLSRLPFFVRVVGIKLARRRGVRWLERALLREENEPLI